MSVANEAIANIPSEHCQKYCSSGVSLENTYSKRDGVIQDLCEPFRIILLETGDDSDFS